MMRPLSIGIVIAIGGGSLFGGVLSALDEPTRYARTEPHMGVPFRIVLYSPDETTANRAFQAAFSRISSLNDILSDYDDQSELMRLCESSGPGKPIALSDDLFAVLQRAETISQQTDGAFDVTVGPIVRLWRRARRQKELPSEERLRDAKALVDYRFLKLDRSKQTVELSREDMRLDLGGIAKGYAVDEAMKVLKQHGITSALVDGSGDLLVSDPPPGKEGWKIGVAALETPEGTPREFLTLSNAAIATSGDAYQFVEIDGTRYSHIVDPKTGLGVTRRSSVSVLAKDCTTADAWASALSVLPPEEGIRKVVKQDGSECLIVVRDEDKERVFRSVGFGGNADGCGE